MTFRCDKCDKTEVVDRTVSYSYSSDSFINIDIFPPDKWRHFSRGKENLILCPECSIVFSESIQSESSPDMRNRFFQNKKIIHNE